MRAKIFPSPLPPPPPLKVPSVLPKEAKEMHHPEPRKPEPQTIARRQALRLLRSLDISAQSYPGNAGGSTEAGSKMGDVGKEVTLVDHGA